jgi:nucleotide-binding universal stress UspA family protein
MIVLKNILVPTDFGEAAEAALRYGRTLAATFGADLHVLHVMDNGFLHARFADPATLEGVARQELNDRTTPDANRLFRTHAVLEKLDPPLEAITSYATSEGIDLIVMGTHGRAGAAHALMGSVAERVIRTAPCPVLVVPARIAQKITRQPAPEHPVAVGALPQEGRGV